MNPCGSSWKDKRLVSHYLLLNYFPTKVRQCRLPTAKRNVNQNKKNQKKKKISNFECQVHLYLLIMMKFIRIFAQPLNHFHKIFTRWFTRYFEFFFFVPAADEILNFFIQSRFFLSCKLDSNLTVCRCWCL